VCVICFVLVCLCAGLLDVIDNERRRRGLEAEDQEEQQEEMKLPRDLNEEDVDTVRISRFFFT